jgi:hypothetical protein
MQAPWIVGPFAIALFASPALGQSYGNDDQSLAIGAAQFQGEDYVEGFVDSDGYLYNQTGVDLRLAASLLLPDGAEITRLCFSTRDADPDPHLFYGWIRADKLVPGGEGPSSSLIKLVDSADHTGYGSSCSDPFSFTVRGAMDVDGDGVSDAVAYRVGVYIANPPMGASFGFGAVTMTWHRQVSPPPATPTFGDVPASDGAWSHIEALSASGITAGCGGGNYCPDATLTRRQMAVFLAKALGLHWSPGDARCG